MSEESRSLSVLLAGVSGSARLHEKLGAAEAARAVDRCAKRMERAVETFRGKTVEASGDEVMATFDHADKAAQAAVEMLERVADLPPVSGVQLEIRIGLAHGPVTTSAEGRLDGEAVTQAVWLAGHASPGQILTNAATASLLTAALPATIRHRPLDVTDDHAISGGVVELQPSRPSPSIEHHLPADGASPVSGAALRLKLHYHERFFFFPQGDSGSFQMGRDETCNLVIHDRRASRQHATLVWRGERVVLIDKSTNGTYVTIENEPEQFVRRREFMLRGKGMICFSAPIASADADFVCFEFVE